MLLALVLLAGGTPSPAPSPGTAARASPPAELVARGKEVYAANRCAFCHSVAGKGNPKGPHDDVGSRYDAAGLREWITEPARMAKKTKATRQPPMIPFDDLPKEDLDALVAYLSTLRAK